MPVFSFARVVLVLSGPLFLAAAPTHAAIIDPTGDFLPSYTGIRGADLDVSAANVTFDGSRFALSATLNGAVGTTACAFYVFGIDRGAGTERFNTAPLPIGAGVRFDSVFILRPTAPARSMTSSAASTRRWPPATSR